MNRRFVIFLFASSISIGSTLGGSAGDSDGPFLESNAEREIARRQENLVVAEEALNQGDSALQRNDIATAYAEYKKAVDLIPQGSETKGLRSRAVSRYSSAAVRYAQYLVSQGDYAKAESVAREVLEPRYNPDYRPASVFLSRLEQPDYFNKTITTEFAQEREHVGNLLDEANGFYDSGRYDMAQKRYQQALAIDKDNASAFRGLEQVEVGKQRYYESAYNETRSRMLWQVEKAWERPKRIFNDSRVTDASGLAQDQRGTELMTAKLQQIIVPSVNFQDATIQDAMAFLRQKSRELGATDQNGQGINIVLKLPANSAPVPMVGEASLDQPAGTPAAFNDRITLNLTNVPLDVVLRYIATLAGLKVKIEPFAVSMVPLTEVTDTLSVREFKVPPGFISAGSASAADSSGAQAGGTSADTAPPKLSIRQTAKDFLESQGVQFPSGASARFIPGSSRLVVRNTEENLDLIESLVDAAMGEQPTQVEIEAKFVEVSQNNLKELGFDWRVGPFAIGDSGVYGAGGDAGGGAGVPFVNPSGTAVGQNAITSGLRSGNSAISVNSLNALLLGQAVGGSVTSGPAPGIFSIAGVFSNPQFQVVVRALNQKKGVDLMAAPKVTTKSGQKATIAISREFPYPQEFEPPQIPQDSGSGATGGGGAVITRPADPVITPSFPTDFTTRNLGVTLVVEPQIGPDGYTIDLTLSPEVVDFDGFINYGSPISAPVDTVLSTITDATTGGVIGAIVQPQPELLTENVINQPIFSVRKVTTNVSIWDGQTVVLGGLIREDVQKISDKVPLLGDIPIAGVLFRSEVDQKIKRNLIIFTTARLMDAAGQLLRAEDDSDQEETVEPLGLPADLPKPAPMNAKGFSRK